MFNFMLRKIFHKPRRIEKRKKYRYIIPFSMKSQLIVKIPAGNSVSLDIVDLSEEAVAAEYGPFIHMPIPEVVTYPSRLIIDSQELSFTGTLVRYAKRFLVFKYALYSPEEYKKLKDVFPVIIGKSLEDRGAQKTTSDWIHGANDTDIFIQREGDLPKKIFSLTFVSEGFYFYWNQEGTKRTGCIERESYSEGLGFAKRQQNAVKFDPFLDLKKLARFSKIIENASLNVSFQQELLEILRQGE